MRGFYSIAASVFTDDVTPATFGCVVLATHGRTMYLHSHINPNPELEVAGGTLLADDWVGLKGALTAAARKKVFRTLVQREVGQGQDKHTATLFIPEQAVKAGDVVVSSGLVPHKFLGDPEPDPVP